MRLGRHVSAMAGSVVLALAGIFLLGSPWLLRFQPAGRAWLVATKTDFWSGLGILAVALGGAGFYSLRLKSQLEEQGIIGRSTARPELSANRADGTIPKAPSITDADLLAWATALTQESRAGASDKGLSRSADLKSRQDEADLIALTTSLLAEILNTHEGAPLPETSNTQTANPETFEGQRTLRDLPSEAELARWAVNLLDEIQHSRREDFVKLGGSDHER